MGMGIQKKQTGACNERHRGYALYRKIANFWKVRNCLRGWIIMSALASTTWNNPQENGADIGLSFCWPDTTL